MKLNFSILMFFLIVGMPFFLFEEKKEKKGKIEFLQKKEDFKERDTIQLFEIIEGKEEEYLLGFLKNERAYFYNDTIELNLVAGLLDGYVLEIKIIGNEFTGKLRNYSCTWSRDLAIKKQSLILENFKLVNGNELKGEVYCETNRLYSFQNGYVERVKIKGYFEMELFGVNKKKTFFKRKLKHYILQKKEKKYVSKDDAFLKLQRYCAYQERCHSEVRSKLIDLGIYGDDLEDIIVDLISDNFLNEERFAKIYAGGKFRIKKWGRYKIKQKLKFKKVSEYCIKQAMKEIDEEDYIETLHKIFEKRLRTESERNEFKLKGRLAKYAIGRGFESWIVWEELKHLDLKKR